MLQTHHPGCLSPKCPLVYISMVTSHLCYQLILTHHTLSTDLQFLFSGCLELSRLRLLEMYAIVQNIQWLPITNEQRTFLPCWFLHKLALNCFFTLWSPPWNLRPVSLLTFPHRSLALSTQQLCSAAGFVCASHPLFSVRSSPCLPGNPQSTLLVLSSSYLPPPLALLALNLLRTAHSSCNISHPAMATAATAGYISTDQPSFLDQAICISIYFPVLAHYRSPGFIVPLHFQGC